MSKTAGDLEYSFCGKIRTFDIFYGLYIGDMSDRYFILGAANSGEFNMMKLLHINWIPAYKSLIYFEDQSNYKHLLDLTEGVKISSDLSLEFTEGTQLTLPKPIYFGNI